MLQKQIDYWNSLSPIERWITITWMLGSLNWWLGG